MDHTENNMDTNITLLPSFFKVFVMFKMCLWYDKEIHEENLVNNIAIWFINSGKTTGLSVENTNYKDMINKFGCNSVLHHVFISWIIDKNEQLEYDIGKYNPDLITNIPWYNTYSCTKLRGTVFDKYIRNERTDRYKLMSYIIAHEKNIHYLFMAVAAVVVMHCRQILQQNH